MDKDDTKGINWMKILKTIGIGLGFGIAVWFFATLFGDTGAITAAMALVMYLEYKLQ